MLSNKQSAVRFVPPAGLGETAGPWRLAFNFAINLLLASDNAGSGCGNVCFRLTIHGHISALQKCPWRRNPRQGNSDAAAERDNLRQVGFRIHPSNPSFHQSIISASIRPFVRSFIWMAPSFICHCYGSEYGMNWLLIRVILLSFRLGFLNKNCYTKEKSSKSPSTPLWQKRWVWFGFFPPLFPPRLAKLVAFTEAHSSARINFIMTWSLLCLPVCF